MANASQRSDEAAQTRERVRQVVGKGGRGGDAKSFMEGIPKSAWFLAGFVAADLFARRPRGR